MKTVITKILITKCLKLHTFKKTAYIIVPLFKNCMSEGGGKVQQPLNHRGILRLKNDVGVGGGGYKEDKWSWTKCNKKKGKQTKNQTRQVH